MEFTKEEIIKAAKHCRGKGKCTECNFKGKKSCAEIMFDYIISTEDKPASLMEAVEGIEPKVENLQEKLERFAPEQSEYPEMTAENGIDDRYNPTVETGGGIDNRNFDTDTKCAKYCISADTCNKCNSCKLGNSNIECYDLLSDLLVRTAEKEPASAGTLTSSTNDIKTSTDSISLNAENVKFALKILNAASDVLNRIYKSDDFDTLNTGLAVDFGRAWQLVDVAFDLLKVPEGFSEQASQNREEYK